MTAYFINTVHFHLGEGCADFRYLHYLVAKRTLHSVLIVCLVLKCGLYK